jgi:hypothetical protein
VTARLLADHRLLGAFRRLDRALAEGVVPGGDRAVRRAALDVTRSSRSVTCSCTGVSTYVAADADAAVRGLALADAQPLLDDGDALLLAAGPRRPRRRAVAGGRLGGGARPPFPPPRGFPLIDVNRAVAFQHVRRGVELVVRHLRVEDRAAAPDALVERRHVLAGDRQPGEFAGPLGVVDLARHAADLGGEVLRGLLRLRGGVEERRDGFGHLLSLSACALGGLVPGGARSTIACWRRTSTACSNRPLGGHKVEPDFLLDDEALHDHGRFLDDRDDQGVAFLVRHGSGLAFGQRPPDRHPLDLDPAAAQGSPRDDGLRLGRERDLNPAGFHLCAWRRRASPRQGGSPPRPAELAPAWRPSAVRKRNATAPPRFGAGRRWRPAERRSVGRAGGLASLSRHRRQRALVPPQTAQPLPAWARPPGALHRVRSSPGSKGRKAAMDKDRISGAANKAKGA